MKLNPILLAVIVLVVAGGAFFGGMKYQQSKIPAGVMRFTQGAGGPGGNTAFARGQGGTGGAAFARGGMGGLVTGEVLSKDDKSLTVKMRDGGSKIVFFSASTSVMTSSSSTLEAVGQGKTVMVNGTTNSDGSVTAQSINLR